MGKNNDENLYQIPRLEITRIGEDKTDRWGKYTFILDNEWCLGCDDADKFYKYKSNQNKVLSDSLDDDENESNCLIRNKANEYSCVALQKTYIHYEGTLNLSLDLKQALSLIEKSRTKKLYLNNNKCRAFVTVSFKPGTTEIRERLYRDCGFSITYSDNETLNYVRYKRTASGAREGTCLFIAKDLYDDMMNWSYAGFDPEKSQNIDCVSWEAYIALTLSSIEHTMNLNLKQVLFVKDYESDLTSDKINIVQEENGKLSCSNNIISNAGGNSSKNKIWDGEGLIDDSLFSDDETLKEYYPDKSMLLLRGKMFKACVFRTNIQKWFADNNITDINQLNGYTQAKSINDVKYIITYSCLKFLKFVDYSSISKDNISDERFNKAKDKLVKSAIKDWISNNINKNSKQEFGIIKSDKPSKLKNASGESMVFTSYQILNTLGFNESSAKDFLTPTFELMEGFVKSGDEGTENVKNYLNDYYFNNKDKYDDYGEHVTEVFDTFETNKVIQSTAKTLLNNGAPFDYQKTEHYSKTVTSLLDHVKNMVTKGRVLIDGVYGTLLSNGIELLKYSIDKNYAPGKDIILNSQKLPVLYGQEIYTKRFSPKTRLLCARNPHVTMGNYYMPRNASYKSKELYDTYFHLSDEIVCINAVDSNIMNILNGCDFDSDTMLITDNKTMCDLLKQTLSSNFTPNFFRPPHNLVSESKAMPNTDEYDSDNQLIMSKYLSRIDDMISNNNIGRIINLSQRLNSLHWMLRPLSMLTQKPYNNWHSYKNSIGQSLYMNGCCVLAVLSNIEIDSAKRTYACNTENVINSIYNALFKDKADEQKKLLNSYTEWLAKNPKNSTEYIKTLNIEGNSFFVVDSNRVPVEHKLMGLDPMGYIIKAIVDKHTTLMLNIPKATISNMDYFDKIFEQCKINVSNADCKNSFDKVCDLLYSAYNTTQGKNPDYIKQYKAITKLYTGTEKILSDNRTKQADLIWKLTRIFDTKREFIFSINGKYEIVDKDSYKLNHSDYKSLDHPYVLLFAALLHNEETYLMKQIINSIKSQI